GTQATLTATAVDRPPDLAHALRLLLAIAAPAYLGGGAGERPFPAGRRRRGGRTDPALSRPAGPDHALSLPDPRRSLYSVGVAYAGRAARAAWSGWRRDPDPHDQPPGD